MMSGAGDDKTPSRVLDFLYIGSRVHAKNRGLLKELGINRILNVTPPKTVDPTNGVPNFFEKDRSMTYKRVPVFDNRGEDLLQHLPSCISFIEQGKFYGRVLVHCSKGVSRSSTVVAGYIMSTRGLSKDAALDYLRSRRPIVNPHEGFTAQLQTFEKRLKVEVQAAIADGQAPKFPDDLLGSAKAVAAPLVGPIGPARGLPGPTMPPQSVRTKSPSRGPLKRPAVGSSPPRRSKSKSPIREPSPPSPRRNGTVIGATREISTLSKGEDVEVSSTKESMIGPRQNTSVAARSEGHNMEKLAKSSTGGDSIEDSREVEAGGDESREQQCDTVIGPAIGPMPADTVAISTTNGESASKAEKGGNLDETETETRTGEFMGIGPTITADDALEGSGTQETGVSSAVGGKSSTESNGSDHKRRHGEIGVGSQQESPRKPRVDREIVKR